MLVVDSTLTQARSKPHLHSGFIDWIPGLLSDVHPHRSLCLMDVFSKDMKDSCLYLEKMRSHCMIFKENLEKGNYDFILRL